MADVDACADLAGELVDLGHAHGLAAVGVARAEPFESTRRDLEQRRAAGLHGGMSFTYRSPDRSADPTRALPGARSLVVGARAYLRTVPAASRAPAGRVARYAWRDEYAPLRAALTAIAERLRTGGWRARVLADDNALVDREAARRAGIGWYGKNANLLLPGHGSWFVLGSVVTDADLPPARDAVPDGCGACTRCITACPTGAIVAPGVVDARRCLAWLVQAEGDFPIEHRAALGDRIYGCDDCQEVCPPNRRQRPAAAGDGDEVTVDVVAMLEASDGDLLAAHGRWYIARRDPRYLRRNALVVLGNVGSASDARTVDAIRRHRDGADEMLASHAAWAAARLGIT
jgi:epoxyqueuosine reductase